MDEIKDILKCIAIFDSTETDEVKARYFDVIQKDAQNQLELLNKQNVMPRFESKDLDVEQPDSNGDFGIMLHTWEGKYGVMNNEEAKKLADFIYAHLN